MLTCFLLKTLTLWSWLGNLARLSSPNFPPSSRRLMTLSMSLAVTTIFGSLHRKMFPRLESRQVNMSVFLHFGEELNAKVRGGTLLKQGTPSRSKKGGRT